MAKVEKDAHSGTDTTGHEWDGIKELDTPMPRWWLYAFCATIFWSFAYWVAYPAWPSLSGYTKGVLGYSSRGALEEDLAAARRSRAVWWVKFEKLSVAEIVKDSELLNYAMAGGRVIFAENCAPCHGSSGSGRPGYPVLADDDWLWGGTLEDIKTSIAYGIRSTHEDAKSSEMPSFAGGGEEGEDLSRKNLDVLADYVVALSQAGGGEKSKGRELFEENCSACHGEDGKGVQELGAPNLADGIWLYGEGRDAVIRQIASPRHGVMPSWLARLDDVAIKQAAVYVHSLGGGK